MSEKEDKNEKSLTISEKMFIIIGLSNLVLAGCNVVLVYYTYEVRRTSLEFQSIMYNFTSVIVAYADYATLEPSSYFRQDGIIEKMRFYGYLDVNLEVITPHHGIVTIKLKSFNVGDSEYLNSERINETEISYVNEDEVYERSVVMGLNEINDQLHLKAIVYPNSEELPTQGESVVSPLGKLFLEAELFDLQTQTTSTKEFSAGIYVILETPP